MDMEIDPEIAAAMGFGSFGGAPKKRKFGADDAFTSASQEPQQVASKANAVPVAEVRSQRRPVETNETVPAPAPAPAHDNITLADGSVMSLQALRRGIRNERGDMAYFLPSFLEDPWKELGAAQA
ncbi:hypothetical protein Q7P36_000462 [Cladosporium allicinum]